MRIVETLTVTSYVLDEYLHRRLGLRGGGTGCQGGDGGDAVGTHDGGGGVIGPRDKREGRSWLQAVDIS